MRRIPQKGEAVHIMLNETARQHSTPFPCGKCLHCRINKRRELTHRILLENTQHDQSCFVTLTYDEDHVPKGDNLRKSDLINFIKRLRRYIEPTKIRTFHVGEYGGPPKRADRRGYRPHYHLLIFGIGEGWQPAIKHAWRDGNGNYICNFDELDDAGKRWFGDITHDSAQYVCGYTTRKLTKPADMSSPWILENIPELYGRAPEFAHWSRRPYGLGAKALDDIKKEIDKNEHFEPTIIRQLAHGSRNYPLGRYLTEKIACRLGVDGRQFERDFWAYQEELFHKHLLQKENYYESISMEKEQVRRNQKWKYENFNTREL